MIRLKQERVMSVTDPKGKAKKNTKKTMSREAYRPFT